MLDIQPIYVHDFKPVTDFMKKVEAHYHYDVFKCSVCGTVAVAGKELEKTSKDMNEEFKFSVCKE
jgi:hypothetical protein